MLTRRHLRIKVLQALYSYYQSDHKDVFKTEQELFRGIDKTYDLFLFLLMFFPEIAEQERIYRADLPKKHISTTEKPIATTLANNKFIAAVENNASLKSIVTKRLITWQADTELIKQAFYRLHSTDEYKEYVTTADHTLVEDVAFCMWVFKYSVIESELVAHALEEKNIYWADGFEFATSMVNKTIKSGKEKAFEVPYIYKDEEDDKSFMKLLLHNTVKNDAYFTNLIDVKTKNWDVERIALMDVILLKMALAEVLHVETIPIKVTINEYLEISKDFSTPKSNLFINGILDKLVVDLKNESKIVKTGRGLME